MTEIGDKISRDANGRFLAGRSGNPAGKAPGTRNRATMLREAMRDGEDKAAARIVIDRALAGDAVAARFIVGRLMPVPRSRAIALELPTGGPAVDILAAYDRTIAAMAAGEITPDEAVQVTRVLDGRLRAMKAAARTGQSTGRARPQKSPSPLAGEGRGEGSNPRPAAQRHNTPHPPIAHAMGPSLSRRGRGEFDGDLLHSTCISRPMPPGSGWGPGWRSGTDAAAFS